MNVLVRRAARLAAVLLAAAAPASAAAAPSDLDAGFGAGGTALSPFTQGASTATGVALDPQGRLLAVGTRVNAAGNRDWVVARDTADGQADTAFNGNGRSQPVATSPVTGPLAAGGLAIAVQADGKPVVTGQTASAIGVGRLTTGGQADGSFGNDGTRLIALTSATRVDGRAIAIASDGRIVVAGTAFIGGHQRVFVARFTTGGEPDGTFDSTNDSGTGVVFVPDTACDADVPVTDCEAYSLLLADGAIYVGGAQQQGNLLGGRVFKLVPTTGDRGWHVDTTYGSASVPGAAEIPRHGVNDVRALIARPGGGLIAVGLAQNGSDSASCGAAALTASGALDPSFGTGGTTAIALGGTCVAYGAAAQADGRVVFAGETDSGPRGAGDRRVAVGRLTAAGAPDESFAAGGAAAVTLGDGASYARGVLLQDGRPVVAGGAASALGGVFALARLAGGDRPGTGGGGGGGGGGTDPGTGGGGDGGGTPGGVAVLDRSAAGGAVAGRLMPIVVGSASGSPRVRALGLPGLGVLRDFYAFDPLGVTGGVHVATGDVDGDGRAEVVTGAGAGSAPLVKVFDGQSGAVRSAFFAYDPSFRGGVNVAVGDVTGDGKADVIVAPASGAAPRVTVYDGATGAKLMDWLAFGDASARTGASVAAGDVDGDGRDEVVVGAGAGAAPTVAVYAYGATTPRKTFLAGAATDRGGVAVAAGDVDGDGLADVVAGPGAGAPPRVRVFDGATGKVEVDVMAGDAADRSGVSVAVGDVDGDGRGDVLVAPLAGAATVRVFDGSGKAVRQLVAFPGSTLGADVAAVPPAGAGLRGGTVSVAGTTATVPVLCPAASTGGCTVDVTIRATTAAAAATTRASKLVTLASGHRRIAAGRRATIKAKLTRRGRTALAHTRTVRATVTVTSRDKAGNRRVATRKVKLKRGASKRR
ncbi:MAG TPA: FG-GAP-like repeat-containing protein [Baekduia sp.]|uniref:FG-GAP-like repeat-containing protein n=1 Tax=Baekduia sp. TaxID=2600305 RepID=UPI002D77A38F|nr:FG-GAP-like repeat-containing protein [Baekduia sp.]HET6509897.1 FG-GAP-like repeat-containing protein [Baekduia sp.]